MKLIFTACCLLTALFAGSLQAQDTTDLWQRAKKNPNLGRQKFIEMKFHSGAHLYTGEELKDLLEKGYTSVEMRIGWESTGRQEWQRVFNYPSYGLGFYTGNIGDATILGNPSGLYGFFYAPVLRRKRHHFEAGLSLGFTYDLNTYDSKTNPLNDAISSKVSVYFNIGAGGVWKISELFDIVYGLDFTHFSNGRTHTPNLGLNMYGFNVGLRYHYNSIRRVVLQQIDPGYEVKRRPVYVESFIPPPKRYHEMNLYGAFGVVQTDKDMGTDAFYGTASAVLDYRYRYGHAGSVGVGLDGFYDASLGWIYAQRYNKVRTADKMLMGIHIGHSLHIQKFELVTQVGAHVWQRDDEKKRMYMRVGLRYNLSSRAFAQIGLKTVKGATADWVEWGGGGTFWRSK